MSSKQWLISAVLHMANGKWSTVRDGTAIPHDVVERGHRPHQLVSVCVWEGRKKGRGQQHCQGLAHCLFLWLRVTYSISSSWQDCRNAQLPAHRLSTVTRSWIQTLQVWATVCFSSYFSFRFNTSSFAELNLHHYSRRSKKGSPAVCFELICCCFLIAKCNSSILRTFYLFVPAQNSMHR